MDPYQIEAAIELPPLNISSSASLASVSTAGASIVHNNSNSRYRESLQDANGFEWGPVLSALLDASDAALAVRFLVLDC